MKNRILGSKTINQNVHQQKFLSNAKIFKERRFLRTTSIFSALFLQTIYKNEGRGGIKI